ARQRREDPGRHAGQLQVGAGGDRSRARAVARDQGDLAEVVARAERAARLAVDADLGLAVEDDEEADAGLALPDDLLAGGHAPLAHARGDLADGAVVEPAQERDV